MGLNLLRLSGLRIPTEIIKRVVQPIVLESSFTYDPAMHPIAQETIRESQIKSLIKSAEKYMDFEVSDTDDGRLIRVKLIIQRPDPFISKEKGLLTSE